MKRSAILACDVGTSSVKATLFDEHGCSIASASKVYSAAHPNAEDMEIAAIGCSRHMMGSLPVDRDGLPLYSCTDGVRMQRSRFFRYSCGLKSFNRTLTQGAKA